MNITDLLLPHVPIWDSCRERGTQCHHCAPDRTTGSWWEDRRSHLLQQHDRWRCHPNQCARSDEYQSHDSQTHSPKQGPGKALYWLYTCLVVTVKTRCLFRILNHKKANYLMSYNTHNITYVCTSSMLLYTYHTSCRPLCTREIIVALMYMCMHVTYMCFFATVYK